MMSKDLTNTSNGIAGNEKRAGRKSSHEFSDRHGHLLCAPQNARTRYQSCNTPGDCRDRQLARLPNTAVYLALASVPRTDGK
jgi:hypothetical protein